tara:strand:- start:245 stop:433 length:189 start_codon:yes stop_codon:yes gene_type:complete
MMLNSKHELFMEQVWSDLQIYILLRISINVYFSYSLALLSPGGFALHSTLDAVVRLLADRGK